MCMDCGCGNSSDDMGSEDHITTETISKAAQASEISVEQTLKNVRDAIDAELAKLQASA